MMKKKRLFFILVFFLISFVHIKAQNPACHYTCTTCTTPAYYDCLTCPLNRGLESKPFTPFAGMCYCTESTDEN